MLNENKTGLSILDNFIVDKNLPKFTSKNKENYGDSTQSNIGWGEDVPPNGVFGDTVDNSAITLTSPALTVGGVPVLDSKGNIIRNTFWGRFKFVYNSVRNKDNRKLKLDNPPKPTLSVEEFFKSIKNNSKELSKIEKRAENYISAIKEAKQFGQTALFEKLEKMLSVVRQETQLFALGLKQTILEEQVVTFYKESEKGIRLDWIKNFARAVPAEFLTIKQKLDDIGVFDNYAIMHYDPDTKAFSETIAEKKERIRKKRDPILFGLMRGSRKLYYIGDWEDEYCDLTLEDFVEKFGKKELNKNNLTATVKIDKK